MKQRIKAILTIVLIFTYLIFAGRADYLLTWLADRYFLCIWIPIILLYIFKQDIIARWLTVGSIGAVPLGEVMEFVKFLKYGENQAAHSSYWGVATWAVAVVICTALGILFQLIHNRKNKPKEPVQETAAVSE